MAQLTPDLDSEVRSFFRGLSADELARLDRLAHPRRYDVGQIIVHQGQGGIAFFAVTQGQVAITRSASDGQSHEIRRIGPGEWPVFRLPACRHRNRRRADRVSGIAPA